MAAPDEGPKGGTEAERAAAAEEARRIERINEFREKSLEEREKEYAAVRARILGTSADRPAKGGKGDGATKKEKKAKDAAGLDALLDAGLAGIGKKK